MEKVQDENIYCLENCYSSKTWGVAISNSQSSRMVDYHVFDFSEESEMLHA